MQQILLGCWLHVCSLCHCSIAWCARWRIASQGTLFLLDSCWSGFPLVDCWLVSESAGQFLRVDRFRRQVGHVVFKKHHNLLRSLGRHAWGALMFYVCVSQATVLKTSKR